MNLLWCARFSLLVLWFSPTFSTRDTKCSRPLSRVVQRLVDAELEPIYRDIDATMPTSCPLHVNRNMYSVQESHKSEDGPSRYTCNYCAKSFYEERFIDQHFDHKHQDTIRKSPDAVCMADYCDIFRCDVITGQAKAQYWDRVLCKESNLTILRHECQDLFAECVPEFLVGDEKREFKDKLIAKVCGYLTCTYYWDLPDSQTVSISHVYYFIGFLILGVVVFVYYYVAYTHFYTDDSLIEQWKSNDDQDTSYHYEHWRNEIRHRQISHR